MLVMVAKSGFDCVQVLLQVQVANRGCVLLELMGSDNGSEGSILILVLKFD